MNPLVALLASTLLPWRPSSSLTTNLLSSFGPVSTAPHPLQNHPQQMLRSPWSLHVFRLLIIKPTPLQTPLRLLRNICRNPQTRSLGFAGNHNGVVPLLPSLSASVVRPLCSPLQQQPSLAHHPRHHRRRRSQGCQAQSRREYGAPQGCTNIKSSWLFSFYLQRHILTHAFLSIIINIRLVSCPDVYLIPLNIDPDDSYNCNFDRLATFIIYISLKSHNDHKDHNDHSQKGQRGQNSQTARTAYICI